MTMLPTTLPEADRLMVSLYERIDALTAENERLTAERKTALADRDLARKRLWLETRALEQMCSVLSLDEAREFASARADLATERAEVVRLRETLAEKVGPFFLIAQSEGFGPVLHAACSRCRERPMRLGGMRRGIENLTDIAQKFEAEHRTCEPWPESSPMTAADALEVMRRAALEPGAGKGEG